jgi:hypothetical protein
MKKIVLVIALLGLLNTSSFAAGEPTGVSATEGTYSDVIVVTWDITGTYSYYFVFRDNALLDSGVTSSPYYDTLGLIPGETFEYQIKACNYIDDIYGSSCSSLSIPTYGFVLENSPSYGPELPENVYWVSPDDDANCFIATAAYGSYMESHVITLRKFRDSYLLTNKLGTKFVRAYYKYSPLMAKFIARHGSLRFVARIVLAPLVSFSWLAINYGMMIASTILFYVFTLIIGSINFIVKTREDRKYL